jgi:hypothetical protein
MIRRIRRRLSGAHVMAFMALVVALGMGTAWALERNSVHSAQIAPNAAKGVDVAEGSLKIPRKLVDHTTTTAPGFGGGAITADAKCPKGWAVTGGGFSNNDPDVRVAFSLPSFGANQRSQWTIQGIATPGEHSLSAWAVCVKGKFVS